MRLLIFGRGLVDTTTQVKLKQKLEKELAKADSPNQLWILNHIPIRTSSQTMSIILLLSIAAVLPPIWLRDHFLIMNNHIPIRSQAIMMSIILLL